MRTDVNGSGSISDERDLEQVDAPDMPVVDEGDVGAEAETPEVESPEAETSTEEVSMEVVEPEPT